MAIEMENLVKVIHGSKMNGNLINRLVKGWVEKNRINGWTSTVICNLSHNIIKSRFGVK